MQTKELDYILDRRSIRRFTVQKIDNEMIKIILTAAMYAPSAVNMQPWHFIVIDDPSMMVKIMEIHPYARMLHLPSKVKPFALVALGYPEEYKPRPERFHAEKVRYNGWDPAFFQE